MMVVANKRGMPSQHKMCVVRPSTGMLTTILFQILERHNPDNNGRPRHAGEATRREWYLMQPFVMKYANLSAKSRPTLLEQQVPVVCRRSMLMFQSRRSSWFSTLALPLPTWSSSRRIARETTSSCSAQSSLVSAWQESSPASCGSSGQPGNETSKSPSQHRSSTTPEF